MEFLLGLLIRINRTKKGNGEIGAVCIIEKRGEQRFPELRKQITKDYLVTH